MKTRLFCLLARGNRRAVIFRRGPTNVVLVVGWTRASPRQADAFEEGQWLRGRIYERRCDLSPSGELLLYFAAQRHKPMETWTAISRVPNLSALALFPKGDSYGGGGMFTSESSIVLNHPYVDPHKGVTLAPGFSLPRGFSVKTLGMNSGAGEDFPLYAHRLERDGWSFVEGRGFPWIWRKPQPGGRLVLEQRILSVSERRGAGDWWVVEHAVLREGETVLDLGRSEWADWDDSGELLYARDGVLYRLGRKQLRRPSEMNALLLIDLRERRFENKPPAASAARW